MHINNILNPIFHINTTTYSLSHSIHSIQNLEDEFVIRFFVYSTSTYYLLYINKNSLKYPSTAYDLDLPNIVERLIDDTYNPNTNTFNYNLELQYSLN